MSKYTVNDQFKLSANEGVSDIAKKNYIIAHESGNDSDLKHNDMVINEAMYMKRNWREAYVHYWVGGGGRVYRIGEEPYVAWGAYTEANVNSPAQVELARTGNRAIFLKDYAVYVTLLRDLAKKYGIPLELDKGGRGTRGIKTHKWVSNNLAGDHTDPVDYLKRWGITQKQFAKDLANGINEAPSYHANGSQFKVTGQKLNAYKDIAFKTKTGKSYAKGKTFSASVVKYGDITRLKDANGNYYSANTELVSKVK